MHQSSHSSSAPSLLKRPVHRTLVQDEPIRHGQRRFTSRQKGDHSGGFNHWIGKEQQRRPKDLVNGLARDREWPGPQWGTAGEFLDMRNATNLLGATHSSGGKWNHGNIKDSMEKWATVYTLQGGAGREISALKLIEAQQAFPPMSHNRSGGAGKPKDLVSALAQSLAIYNVQAGRMHEALSQKNKAGQVPHIVQALTNAAKEIESHLSSLETSGAKGVGALPASLIEGLLEAFSEDDATGLSGATPEIQRSICAMLRNLRPSHGRLVSSDLLDSLRHEVGAKGVVSESTPELPVLNQSEQPRPGSSVRAFRAMQEMNHYLDTEPAGPTRVLTPPPAAELQGGTYLTEAPEIVQLPEAAPKQKPQVADAPPKSIAGQTKSMEGAGQPQNQAWSPTPSMPARPRGIITPPQEITGQPFAVKVEFPALPPWWDIYFMRRRAANGPWKREAQESFYAKGSSFSKSSSSFHPGAATLRPEELSKTLPTGPGWKNKNPLAVSAAKTMKRNLSDAMLASDLPPTLYKQSLTGFDSSKEEIDMLLDQMHEETLARRRYLAAGSSEGK